MIVPLHKKGSRMMCSNYRGISILRIPRKVYTRILDGRERNVSKRKVMEMQGGGVPRRKRLCGSDCTVFMDRIETEVKERL